MDKDQDYLLPTEESDEYFLLVNWLQQLPADATVLWTSDHLGKEQPYAHVFADINVPEFEKVVDWNWTLTVQAPDDENGITPLTIVLPHDTEAPYHGGAVGDDPTVEPAWSAALITGAIAKWSEDVAERPDLRWVWDSEAPPSPWLLRASQEAENFLTGSTPDAEHISWEDFKKALAGREQDGE